MPFAQRLKATCAAGGMSKKFYEPVWKGNPMESLEENLRKIAGGISKGNTVNSSSTEAAEIPQPLRGDPNCPICHGIGFVRRDLPIDHPEFGKLSICTCRSKEVARIERMRLYRLSNLGRQQRNLVVVGEERERGLPVGELGHRRVPEHGRDREPQPDREDRVRDRIEAVEDALDQRLRARRGDGGPGSGGHRVASSRLAAGTPGSRRPADRTPAARALRGAATVNAVKRPAARWAPSSPAGSNRSACVACLGGRPDARSAAAENAAARASACSTERPAHRSRVKRHCGSDRATTSTPAGARSTSSQRGPSSGSSVASASSSPPRVARQIA